MSFFSPAPAKPVTMPQEAIDRRFTFLRYRQVVVMLVVYALFYVCRLAFSATKKTLIDQGVYSAQEIGYVGAAMLWAYAIGKIVNGFLADRANVKRFIGFGLFVTAFANMLVGFKIPALMLIVVWFVNGFAQASGAPCCVVSLSRWFVKKERGTFYGIWSCSNNLGEAIAYVLTSVVMVFVANHFGVEWGWRSGFWGAAFCGIVGIGLIALFFKDSPESEGLPPVATWKHEATDTVEKATPEAVKKGQRLALTNWAVWMVALSGGLFAASRYAIIDWGIFFLEVKKGYPNTTASTIITLNSFVGIFSSFFSGIVSDRLFKGSRNELALIGGLMNVAGLSLLMLVPGRHLWVDVTAMALFGFAAGILLTFLGGLMTVDLVPRIAAGAALGIAGLGNYLGAGLQSIISGYLVCPLAKTAQVLPDGSKLLADGSTLFKNGKLVSASGETLNRFYDFTLSVGNTQITVDWIAVFWIGVALLSLLCALSVWNAGKKRDA